MPEEEEVSIPESELEIMTSFQKSILNFLDDEKSEVVAEKDKKLFNMLKIGKENLDISQILRLLISIADNHHRGPNFFSKIDQI